MSAPWNNATILHRHLAVIGSYLLGTLYILAAVLPHFATAVPGTGVAQEDAWQNVWNLWWTKFALAHGEHPYHTTMVYYPYGMPLYFHTLNITNALITLPVQLIAGPIAAYNFGVILGFVLGGYFTYLLALHLLKHHPAAWAAGALFTFSPFHLARLWDGHFSWVTLQWVPLAMLITMLAIQTRRWPYALLAGLVIATAALTSWYYAIYLFGFTGLLVLVRLPVALRHHRWRGELWLLALTGGVSLLVVAPVLIPTLQEASTQSAPPELYVADLLDFIFPSPLHPLWGEQAAAWHNELYPRQWFWSIAPGIGVIVLAGIGSWHCWQRLWQWVLITAGLLLFAMGPTLHIAGHNTGIPLPYALLDMLPGAALGHRPNHFTVAALPLLVTLAGCGIQTLWQRQRTGKTILAGLSAIIIIEYMVVPCPILPFEVDPVFEQMRGQAGAVLDLPPDRRTASAMNHQMVHERPIVGGYLSREPNRPAFVKDVPWVEDLWRMYEDTEGDDIVVTRPDDGWQALSYYGIRTIVVRRTDLQPAYQQNFRRFIQQVLPGIEVTYHSPRVLVYDVPPVEQPRPFLYLGTGWYPREGEGNRSWRWMGKSSTVRLVNPDRVARWVTLTLDAHAYQHTRPLTLHLDTHRLATFDIPHAGRQVRLRLVLSPGEHTLHFTSTPTLETSSAAERTISLSFSSLDIQAGD